MGRLASINTWLNPLQPGPANQTEQCSAVFFSFIKCLFNLANPMFQRTMFCFDGTDCARWGVVWSIRTWMHLHQIPYRQTWGLGNYFFSIHHKMEKKNVRTQMSQLWHPLHAVIRRRSVHGSQCEWGIRLLRDTMIRILTLVKRRQFSNVDCYTTREQRKVKHGAMYLSRYMVV